MILSHFHKAWEKDREEIEKKLKEKIKDEIHKIDISMRRGSLTQEDLLEINKTRNQLLVREAMSFFESEEIARNRMQLRTSYLALVLSSIALIISILTVLFK